MDDDVLNFVLDRCVDDMLNEGLGVEKCLSKYPSHKDELHPLLETVEILRSLRTLPVPSEVQARILERLKIRSIGSLN